MTENDASQDVSRAIAEVMASVQLPLENVEFTIEQYLLEHGCRLDTPTRVLLAGVRDCVGRVAVSTRRLTRRQDDAAPPARTSHAA